jgi:hypothetical protein
VVALAFVVCRRQLMHRGYHLHVKLEQGNHYSPHFCPWS